VAGRRPTTVQLEDFLSDTEQHLVRLRDEHKAVNLLAAKHGVDKLTVRRWVKVVRKRWGDEAKAFDRDEMRGEMTATLNEIIALALNTQVPLRERTGELARYPAKLADGVTPHPKGGEVIYKLQPDKDAALKAIAQLRSLWGLDMTTKTVITASGGGDAPRSVSMETTADERNELEAALKGMAVNRVIDVPSSGD
jgi:hypothetical protein